MRFIEFGFLSPKPMIHVRDHEFEPPILRNSAQQVQKDHRIAPPRDGNEQPPAANTAARKGVLNDGIEHATDDTPGSAVPCGGTERDDREKWHAIRRWVLSAPAMSPHPKHTDRSVSENLGDVPPDSGAPPLGHDVGDWLRHWAILRPEALAWSDDSRRCDYQTADRRVTFLAAHLASLGVGAGDRVAMWLGNRGAILEVLFAAARLGAIALPINARLTAQEVAFQLDDSTPRVLLAERAWRDRVQDAIGRTNTASPLCLEVGTEDAAAADAYEEAIESGAAMHLIEPFVRAIVGPEDPLILMYTSGTTGKPKGALLPYRKALYNSLNARIFFAIRPQDRVLVVAPLFHSLGLQILAIPAIFAGAGLVIQEGFDPTRVWNAIKDERITYFGGVPTLHQRLLEALESGTPIASPPADLRFAFTAGAAAPAELIRAFDRHGVVLKQGYGQTETSILTCLDADRALEKAGSVGSPVTHGEIRLIDPTTIEGPVDAWRDVEPDEVGEVVVAGPITMLGYWQRPEATAETLREGWLRTGDLATRDEDFDLRLVGRAREMYISGGENVYPAEVEATLLEHPDISEAAVVAIPDPTWGEVGRAHVVAAENRTIDPAEVARWLKDRLARYKQPKIIVVEPMLPRTASGKIQKHRLTTP